MELADKCGHFLVVILLPPYQVTHILYVQSDQFLHCIPFVLTITLGLRKFTKFNPSTCGVHVCLCRSLENSLKA